jgi:hypothetical protein
MELNLDQIIRMSQAKAGAQQARHGKGVKPAPSLGQSARSRGPSQPVDEEADIDKLLTSIDTSKFSDADIDKVLRKIGRQVVESAP